MRQFLSLYYPHELYNKIKIMNSNSIQSPVTTSLLEVARRGTYFYPAYKHYGTVTNVQCDRCHRTNLKSSIGFNDKDLCLKCAENLIELNAQTTRPIIVNDRGTTTEVHTEMMRPIFKPRSEVNSYMEQSIFKPKTRSTPEVMTFMVQSMFNPMETRGGNAFDEDNRSDKCSGYDLSTLEYNPDSY